MNLQEYDIVVLRACYAALPPYFLLAATPGHENEKKHWREAVVAALKTLVAKEELGKLSPAEKRHTAYTYPTAQEVRATYGIALKSALFYEI